MRIDRGRTKCLLSGQEYQHQTCIGPMSCWCHQEVTGHFKAVLGITPVEQVAPHSV